MRTTREINMQPIDSSTFMTIITMGLYLASIIGSITLQGAAAIAAILAGVSTFIYNIYRFYKEYNNKQNKNP